MSARRRRAVLYLDAARSVTARQAAGRLRRLAPVRVLAAGTASQPPAFAALAADLGSTRTSSSGPAEPPHEAHAFRAVGKAREFPSSCFWSDPSDGLLLLFELHGFEDLARYAAGPRSRAGDSFWAAVARSWLELGSRPQLPAWHPYPTSHRIVAWAAALSAIDSWPDDLRRQMTAEVWRQARYLRRAVEHDIGGNHVLKNALALVVAGAVFPASALGTSGFQLLRRETRRQVLADGGHEERSPSYHLHVLEDLRDAEKILRRSAGRSPDWLAEAIDRMQRWCRSLAGPDGRLPLLNDAWECPQVPRPSAERVTELADSGYVVLREGRDQLIFDVGELSPPHLPPHAHADALSFVLWGDGVPLVIDPGAYTYSGQGRDSFRATRAHNTVELEGQDQCVFWGDFRAGLMPHVRYSPPRLVDGATVTTASHDGYQRLPEGATHWRSIVWWPPHGAAVVDVLRGKGNHSVLSCLHLHPSAPTDAAERVGPFVVRSLGAVGRPTWRGGSYAPYLGRCADAPVIEATGTVTTETPFGWSLLRPPARVESLERGRLVMRADTALLDLPLRWE